MAEGSGKSQPGFSMERANALATEAYARLRQMEPGRRTRLLTAAGLLVASLAAVLWFANRTDWRVLYAGLDSDDARQIAQELTTAKIPFDVSPDGSALRVPVQNLDKARLITTAKGGPTSGRMGFEIFDKPNWMGSEFDEKVNYQRALEGELEQTIDTLNAVRSARVNLVMPHDSLFEAKQRMAKASVVLRLRHPLSDDQVQGIENLVASAVDGLRAENVVVVDAAGGGLLGHESPDARVNRQEREMAEKLVETIEPVAGAGNVRASVNVDYSPVSADETDETYNPAQTATLSMQSTDQSSAQPTASGVPGTASNAPNTKPPLYPPQTPATQTMKQQSATYGVSKKVRHTEEAAGGVRRLTAAVLINYRPVGTGKQMQWQPRSAQEMKELTNLAEAAIGFDPSRGDQISVEEIPFNDNVAPQPVSRVNRWLAAIARQQGLLRYGVILAALLGVFLFVARPVVKSLTAPAKARPAAKAAAGAQQLAAQPETPELGSVRAVSQQRVRAQNVFEQVSEQVKRDPAQSTRLLESWIRSE